MFFFQVEKLDELVTKMAGFEKRFMVTGQTYPRKVDYNVLAGLSGLGATIHKVCCLLFDQFILTSIRILEITRELEILSFYYACFH